MEYIDKVLGQRHKDFTRLTFLNITEAVEQLLLFTQAQLVQKV